MLILDAVLVEPLTREWEEARAGIEALIAKESLARSKAAATRAHNDAVALHARFIERLRNLRVLDPACGSGNFLYLALRALKDLEHRANLESEVLLGTPAAFPTVGPEALLGIEVNPYAAELARVSVWIGEIQWMRRNGFEASRNPILRPLDTIECRDALLNPDGTETDWPKADVIVGNPPFLGAKLMKRSLGAQETERIRSAFQGRLPGFTDLVCYWFEKARAELATGRTSRVGLVATSKISKNTNLHVLRRIGSTARIYRVHSELRWIVEGAAVRVSVICFSNAKTPESVLLDGCSVGHINPNLTNGVDTSELPSLVANKGVAFVGIQKSGPFDIPGDVARSWLLDPANPNGRRNSAVLRPTLNGNDVTNARRDVWLIDFPRGLSEREAALWEKPFEFLASAQYDAEKPELGLLREFRKTARDVHPKEQWWTTYWPRPEVRRALSPLDRFIATPMQSEHRVFIWLSLPVIPAIIR